MSIILGASKHRRAYTRKRVNHRSTGMTSRKNTIPSKLNRHNGWMTADRMTDWWYSPDSSSGWAWLIGQAPTVKGVLRIFGT
jgi:hypothetical protein